MVPLGWTGFCGCKLRADTFRRVRVRSCNRERSRSTQLHTCTRNTKRCPCRSALKYIKNKINASCCVLVVFQPNCFTVVGFVITKLAVVSVVRLLADALLLPNSVDHIHLAAPIVLARVAARFTLTERRDVEGQRCRWYGQVAPLSPEARGACAGVLEAGASVLTETHWTIRCRHQALTFIQMYCSFKKSPVLT